jgi:YidC/Oxa1 family membrane protein insertase
MQNKKLILALAVFAVFMAGWYTAKMFLFPHPPQPTNPGDGAPKVVKAERVDTATVLGAAVGPGIKFEPVAKDIVVGQAVGPGVKLWRAEANRKVLALGAGPFIMAPAAEAPKKPPVAVAPPKTVTRRIPLGSKDPNSKYHLFVELDARGAGVRRVVLNKFQAVDDKGQPEWDDPKTKKVRKLEELVPVDPNGDLSYLLYHFDPKNADKDAGEEPPLPTLGNVEWEVVDPRPEATGNEPGATQRVVFETHKVPGVVIQKVYTLAEGEYHLGCEVRMFKADPADTKDLWFRYQFAGAHGLPIEGRWYTNIFRNALIALIADDGTGKGTTVYERNYQDARTIALKGGGDEVGRDSGHFIRYAAVAIQYFTSAIVVDDRQEKQAFLTRARPTLEITTVKGTIRTIAPDMKSFVLTVAGQPDETIYLPDPSITKEVVFGLGQQVGVLYRTDSQGRAAATRLLPAKETQPVFENDITVRVATEPINLKDATDEQHAVVHKYLLYNGPMKPMLLGHMKDAGTVSDELVDRYVNKLTLNTLVDYHSPGMMGTFANTIGWTWLVIHTTNLMHFVLGLLSSFLPYALCIIVLTIMVRGLMFPISRKAALTSIRMQELQPEIKKLKEKHKDDPQALNMAVWQLQRKSGANPLSTCWLMFLQMPIFMGLYYALQESIHFRAAPFWPTWIHNLAAPDMLWEWGSSIPWISAPESYGNFIYLGPYFNILPVIAVTLMIFQQKMTMPPPTDEQQEMQQKMMKYMMVFMGLMFYKVPSGLVLYFIASSVWGFCERKLLPKKKKPAAEGAEEPKEGFLQKLLSRPAAKDGVGVPVAPTTAITVSNGKGRNRVKQGKKKRKSDRTPAAGTGEANGSMFQRLSNWWRQRRDKMNDWWEKIREEAQKKNR